MTTATKLITAEEYAQMPDFGYPNELVRGEIVEMNMPKPRHGQVCGKALRIIGNFADEKNLGHIVGNDGGIITERDPDTIRGGDVWFISYKKIPIGPLPQSDLAYLDVPPDIVVEVKSVFDRWNEILGKVAEYLRAGVAVVCVLDPETETVRLYRDEEVESVLSSDEAVTFPDELPNFSVVAKAFFE